MKFTKSIKATDLDRKWIVLDATDIVFGRLLTQIAIHLRGKNKPYFTPHVDCGDYVIVINASKVKLNGNNKLATKDYKHHTGYVGSVKSEKFEKLLDNNVEKLYRLAIRGMLPKNKLGKLMIKKLKVYAGSEHPHTAQIKG